MKGRDRETRTARVVEECKSENNAMSCGLWWHDWRARFEFEDKM
jgi:hypothetical protein